MNVQGTTVQISEADVTALAERARGGDREAFADLYRHFQRRVFVLCRHLLRSKEEAEDATGLLQATISGLEGSSAGHSGDHLVSKLWTAGIKYW